MKSEYTTQTVTPTMARFLPWSEEKSLQLARDGKGADLILAYDAGFRMSPHIIDTLLVGRDYDTASHFYDLGYDATWFSIEHAIQHGLARNIVWLVNHPRKLAEILNTASVWYYTRHGPTGLQALLQAGFVPSPSTCMLASLCLEKELEYVKWVFEHTDLSKITDQDRVMMLDNSKFKPTIHAYILSKVGPELIRP